MYYKYNTQNIDGCFRFNITQFQLFNIFIQIPMSLSEIAAMESMMNMAITGQQHVDALVGYYRSEIDKYNDERAEWALTYEQLKHNASNKYTLQQEIDNSRHRINDFQANLSTIKANLAFERQKYFQKLQDNQAHKDKLEQNKKRYREFMVLCKPINVNKKIGANHKLSKNKVDQSNNFSRLSGSSEEASSVSKSSKGQAELQLINVGRQHEQQKGKLQRQIDSLKDQLDQLISEHSERGRNCSKEYKQALESLALVESKIMHLTSEYFKLRMDNYEEERRIQEQNEILRLKAVALAKRLQIMRDSHTNEFKSVNREVKQRNKDFKDRYDEQLKQKQDHLTILKQQNERINNIYLMKLKKLQEELRTVNDKQKTIDSKTKVEVNSMKGQMRILKARLQKEGVREMRAQIVEEDQSQESSDTLSMSELQKINKEVDALQRHI